MPYKLYKKSFSASFKKFMYILKRQPKKNLTENLNPISCNQSIRKLFSRVLIISVALFGADTFGSNFCLQRTLDFHDRLVDMQSDRKISRPNNGGFTQVQYQLFNTDYVSQALESSIGLRKFYYYCEARKSYLELAKDVYLEVRIDGQPVELQVLERAQPLEPRLNGTMDVLIESLDSASNFFDYKYIIINDGLATAIEEAVAYESDWGQDLNHLQLTFDEKMLAQESLSVFFYARPRVRQRLQGGSAPELLKAFVHLKID